VVDYFDALEREQEYERMYDDLYNQYEEHLALYEEMEALMLSEPLEINASCWVGAAPPDMMH